jgi:hypothetical protein
MSQKHKTKIEKLFEHPISGNIDVNRLISALEHYKVEVDMSKESKAKLVYNGEHFSLPITHNKELSKDTIVELRHYLESVGLTPDKL